MLLIAARAVLVCNAHMHAGVTTAKISRSCIYAALDNVTSSEHSEVEADDSSSISDMEIEETIFTLPNIHTAE